MTKKLPRLADLHLHMYGSIHCWDYLDFVGGREVDWRAYEAAYGEAYGERPPIRDVLRRCNDGAPGAREDFRRLFVFGDKDAGNFARFQAKYNLLIAGGDWPRLARGEAEFSNVVDEVCAFIHKIVARQREQGIGYAEQRMLLSPGFTRPQAGDLIGAILKSYASYEDSDIRARLAVSLPRDNPWPDWELVKEAALGAYGRQLTGIDFCNVEEGHPPKKQRELFEEVKGFNRRHPDRALAILYHVGESFGDKSLESAIRWVHEAAEMGVHRLGHAIALGVDPDLYGRHVRGETVDERIDQLRYDLRHAEGLRRHGVAVDAAAAESELRRLRAEPANDTLRVDYDDRRLDEVRARPGIRDRERPGVGRGHRGVPDVQPAHRRHRRAGAPPAAPVRRRGRAVHHRHRRSGHLRHNAVERNPVRHRHSRPYPRTPTAKSPRVHGAPAARRWRGGNGDEAGRGVGCGAERRSVVRCLGSQRALRVLRPA